MESNFQNAPLFAGMRLQGAIQKDRLFARAFASKIVRAALSNAGRHETEESRVRLVIPNGAGFVSR